MHGGDRKIAMLHIKKQYARKAPTIQLPRSASPISPSLWVSRMKTCSSGEYVSRAQKTLPSKEGSTKPLCAFPSSSLTNHPKWRSKLRCSTPIVITR